MTKEISNVRYVSKIIIICEKQYVFSIKKSPLNPLKDNRLELFGGNVDLGETPFEGLIRELQEEEMSGILAEKAKAFKLKPLKLFGIEKKTQCIYQMEISLQEHSQLKAHPDESYGIQTLSQKKIVTLENIEMDHFTPKTIKIFQNLGMIQSEP
ncbi:MAG: NUDIX domain-containing protein [Anaerolineaceae bacterium]|nr:NUDIX domain-containing protein [Anaerolineaceae bacterium]